MISAVQLFNVIKLPHINFITYFSIEHNLYLTKNWPLTSVVQCSKCNYRLQSALSSMFARDGWSRNISANERLANLFSWCILGG